MITETLVLKEIVILSVLFLNISLICIIIHGIFLYTNKILSIINFIFKSFSPYYGLFFIN